MDTSQRAASGNKFSKVVFGLAAVSFVFAPPTARPSGAQELSPPLAFCQGYFALCAASTCTPIPNKKIAVNTATGKTRLFDQADCTCPVILGTSIANLKGGNMQGSCDPPGAGQLWSTYQLRLDIPQAITNWVPHLPEAAAKPLLCPKILDLGNKFVQCFSFSCDEETYINNVPVVTCHCAIGASQTGEPVEPHTAFLSLAGQGGEKVCREYPVAGSLQTPQ